MKSRIIVCTLAVLTIGLLASYDMPKGWTAGGTARNYYEIGTDYGAGQGGKNAGTVRSIYKEIRGNGEMRQSLDAENYKGKRLRLTGYLKTRNVDDWAGLYLRINGPKHTLLLGNEKRTMIARDNMYNRSLKGTNDYTKCEVVLDVPDTADNIMYGAVLNGPGQIWFDRMKLDIVGNDVPVTGGKLTKPTNLDFEE